MDRSLPPGYRLHDGVPEIGAYLRLRQDSGLTPKTAGQAAPVAAGSWYGCFVSDPAGEPVAMGRIIGDGGWYFHIADMAVQPGHQQLGLGSAVLAALVQRIREYAPPGALVNLLASAGGQRLYRKFGFTESPDLGVQIRL